LTEKLPYRVGYFASLNYSKMCISLNMKDPRTIELVKKMLKHFDVVAENFRTGVMEKWGIGYEDLKKVKPDIIFISGSGFGRTGPNKEVPAYAPIVGGFSGYAFENGYPDGEPAEPGCRGWTDTIAAEQASFAILAALYHKANTGEGAHLDLSMTESELAFAQESMIDYSMNGRTHGRLGNLDESMAPHNAYRCKGADKWVAIAVSNDEEWAGMRKAMGNPKWAKDAKFSDALSRWQNRDELDRLVENWTTQHGHMEAMELLQKAGVPAGASLNIEEVCENPQFKERGFLLDIEYPDNSTIRRLAFPYLMSETGRGIYTRPPEVGDQNNYIFHDLMGMTEEEISSLVKEKVIY
jgi:crotonobetainyl-CoA:carnitine CoA-transferase CaiB-like acyl-CoA transferase